MRERLESLIGLAVLVVAIVAVAVVLRSIGPPTAWTAAVGEAARIEADAEWFDTNESLNREADAYGDDSPC